MTDLTEEQQLDFAVTFPETKVFNWYERQIPTTNIYRNALLIEDFVANDISIQELAEKYNLHYTHACKIISLYFKKPDTELFILSQV